MELLVVRRTKAYTAYTARSMGVPDAMCIVLALATGCTVSKVGTNYLLKDVSGHVTELAAEEAEGIVRKISSGEYDINAAGVGKKVDKVDEVTSGFVYKHNPSENPKMLEDAIEDKNAIFGYSPKPSSEKIGRYANSIETGYDWCDIQKVKMYRERRLSYHECNDCIDELVISIKNEGKPIEEIAQAATCQRNQNRINDYINNNDFVGLATMKNRNRIIYENEFGPTAYDLLQKYGTWEKVIEKTKSANAGMDASCGLYDIYYYLYEIE